MRRRSALLLASVALVAGCGGRAPCADCDMLLIAATGEPTTLVPPLVRETVGRDITDQIFERLAVLGPGRAPADPAAYRPALASRWEQRDSVTLRFVLRAGAAWHDGRPVTAADVVFSFAAYTDPALDAPAEALVGRAEVAAEGDSAVIVRFAAPGPELLYDATQTVRVMPAHLWASLPREAWAADTARARLVGSGPFRLGDWTPGQMLVLERADARGEGVRRIVWRFAGDQDAAANLVLAGQADLIETVTSPGVLEQVGRDTTLRALAYPSAVYGFLGFRHFDASGVRHPVLGERAVRRALVLALDRPALVRAVVGPDARVPPGPVSRAAWVWDDSVRVLPHDPAAAARLLDSAGFGRGAGGIRRRGATRLALDILVPATSAVRRNLAQGIQEMWRQAGVAATVTAVDFPVFQERLAAGRFDAMIGAWLDEPSPRGIRGEWGANGSRNQGRYANPVFDSLLAAALAQADPARARLLWRAAFDTLNADAAGIFLYTPTNVAVASRRLSDFEIDPFSWLSGVAAVRKR